MSAHVLGVAADVGDQEERLPRLHAARSYQPPRVSPVEYSFANLRLVLGRIRNGTCVGPNWCVPKHPVEAVECGWPARLAVRHWRLSAFQPGGGVHGLRLGSGGGLGVQRGVSSL